MENTDINISALENIDIDGILKQTIKEKIEKLMEANTLGQVRTGALAAMATSEVVKKKFHRI